MTQPENATPVVLVVDDEALLRWHAADLLSSAGYQVVEADDAASALRIIEDRGDIRLLFTDVQMPGRTGLDLAREVHERWPNVLLLVTSGGVKLADSEIPDHGRFVAKPYEERDLLQHVDGLIAEPPVT
ncbi:response regulator [Beijerinckia sp. L45]|uniref:response regulator n=1 Tax=Beijerinckia sp. L45 TaxID=1641855 RepID=UPI00131DE5DC|nr:response regulator [Beijerinckia sp. L45]